MRVLVRAPFIFCSAVRRYTFPPAKWGPLAWYYWLMIVVAILIVIGIIGIFFSHIHASFFSYLVAFK